MTMWSPSFRALPRDLQRLLSPLLEIFFKVTNPTSLTSAEMNAGNDAGDGGYVVLTRSTGYFSFTKYRQYGFLKNIDSGSGGIYLSTGTVDTLRWQVDGSGHYLPAADNAYSLGNGSYRASVIYAATGTINTSDARAKQDVRAITAAEARVAVRIKALLRAYRFIDAVAEKGDAARIHFGVIAQDVATAFAEEGLDAARYALWCHDAWEASEAIVDENGAVLAPARTAGDRYGIRYDELMAFMVAAL